MKLLTNRFAAAIFASCCTASFASADIPPEVVEVLEKSIEASGGKEKIESIETTRFSGNFSIAAMGMNAQTTIIQVYPDKIYNEQNIPGMGQMLQVYNGEIGWAIDPMQGYRALSEAEIDSLTQNGSLRDMLDYSSEYSSGELLPNQEIDGRPVKVLKLVAADTQNAETHYYHADTGLMVQMEMIADMGPMGELPMTMKVTAYDEQDGIKIPKTMEVHNAGMVITMDFTSIEINSDIDPALFVPPQ